MYKFLTASFVLLMAGLLAAGCGRKEKLAESEMMMPMSVSVEGASPTTNLITKTGAPVQVGSTPAEIVAAEQTPPATGTYIAPTVQEIQQALKNAGIYSGAVDGKAGPKTKKAITEFQQQNNLTADGKVGSKTWEKLKVYLDQEQQ